MLHQLVVVQFQKSLSNLSKILDKGLNYAEQKKIDPSVLLNARLAPDQFPLVRQVRICCDTAKLGVARLAGKDAPVQEDKETSIPELKARIESTSSYLKSMSVKDLNEASQRKVTTPRWEGRYLLGHEYATEHVVPNFYFHLTTAYSILRHNGVDIGKKDFLGDLSFKNP